MKKLLLLLAILSLMLAACGDGDDDDDDENGDNNNQPTADQITPSGDTGTTVPEDEGTAESTTGDLGADAELAVVALLTGNAGEAAPYFCEDDAVGLEEFAAAFSAPAEGQEITADCEVNVDTVTCTTNMNVSGVDTSLGNYSMAIVDGKLCDFEITQ
jgi:hypothetical protein